jgi:hypothetical protein
MPPVQCRSIKELRVCLSHKVSFNKPMHCHHSLHLPSAAAIDVPSSERSAAMAPAAPRPSPLQNCLKRFAWVPLTGSNSLRSFSFTSIVPRKER